MNDPLAGLVAALDLTDTGARTSEDIFTGRSQWMPLGRVFGGQVLAQSLSPRCARSTTDRFVHSMHGYFLRPGDVTLPITFSVDRMHDGRSFSTRRTQAYQERAADPVDDRLVPDRGRRLRPPAGHAGGPARAGVAAAGRRGRCASVDHPVAQHWATGRPFDMRHISSPIYFTVAGERVAAPGGLDEGHRHACPTTRTCTAPHSRTPATTRSWSRCSGGTASPGGRRGSRSPASTTRCGGTGSARVDEWLLYVQESPNAIGGRGSSLGRIYRRDGALLASVAQEGMVRVPRRR